MRKKLRAYSILTLTISTVHIFILHLRLGFRPFYPGPLCPARPPPGFVRPPPGFVRPVLVRPGLLGCVMPRPRTPGPCVTPGLVRPGTPTPGLVRPGPLGCVTPRPRCPGPCVTGKRVLNDC